ncbi:MAG: L,D-transpeptidase family protein [bacterium]|nr:L,D-transpeptidase family protein [bacterium]
MQTIKTSVVVVLLLAVCYGAFVALNAPDPDLPDSMRVWLEETDLEQLLPDEGSMASMDAAVPIDPSQLIVGGAGGLSTPGNPTQLPSSLPNLSLEPMSTATSPVSVESSSVPLPAAGLPGGSPDQIATNLGGTIPTPPADLGLTLPGNNSGTSNTNALPDLANAPKLEGFPALATPGAATQPTTEQSAGLPGSGNRYAVGAETNTPLVSGEKNPGNAMTLGYQQEPSAASPPAATGSTSRPQPTMAFAAARQQALDLANQQQLKEALALLSPYFNSPELGAEESADLIDLLDALSREVVYSKRHLLEPPHVVSATDNVASVAEQYSITPELLNALNGLGNSKALVPGSQLKVVRGPINAQVSLSKQELTLFVSDLYAGRFPVTFGKDPAPKLGSFEVVARQQDRTYYASGGNVIQGKEPMNPYGGYWLNLGNDLCIHGTAEMSSSDLEDAGCISLAPLDAQHVFNILVVGSEVAITP